MKKTPVLGLLVGAILGTIAPSQAQIAWPAKPVRLLVGFSAGGPTDIVARAFAEHASRTLGQPFVVDNKPGANTILAAEAVAGASADGYTLLLGATNHTMIPALYGNRVKFDVIRSFVPVCTVAVSPTVLVVGPSMPVKTLDAFVRTLEAQPGKRTYATPGNGSSGHFATEQFLRMTRTSMTHIPYKGASQAVTDLMGGQVDSSFATMGSVLQQLQGGKLTALAVAAPSRSALLPDVPTFEEAGVKGYSADAWYGLLAPANTSPAIVEALRKAAIEFAQLPATKEKFRAIGMVPQSICTEAFSSQLGREVKAYGELARSLNLKAE